LFETLINIKNNISNVGGILRGILGYRTICFVSRKATLKGNILIWMHSKILNYLKVEAPTAFEDKLINIGQNCLINSFTCLFGEIKIGDGVLIGPNVSIIALDHDYSERLIKNIPFEKLKLKTMYGLVHNQ